MGDRFYEQQGLTISKTREPVKKERKLKSEWIAEINAELGVNIEGLDKCTIATLSELLSSIQGVKLNA